MRFSSIRPAYSTVEFDLTWNHSSVIEGILEEQQLRESQSLQGEAGVGMQRERKKKTIKKKKRRQSEGEEGG